MKMPIEKLLMSLILAQVPFYSACNFGKTGQVSRTKRCCFFCISVSETGWLFGSKKVDKVTHYQQGNELENIIVLGIQLEWGLFFVTKRQSDPFSARDICVWCCFPVFVLRAHLAPSLFSTLYRPLTPLKSREWGPVQPWYHQDFCIKGQT